MTNTALVRTDPAAMMPAMSIQDAVERYGLLVKFVSALLKADIDYGQIPGTNKPTLLKPGAEKLLTFFGLTKRFAILEKTEDWMGADHGEPFFYYLYRCALYYGDQLIAESDGSCNSFETKYRYRKAERQCPACGKAAIIKGREEYGGGWVCFKKKDGCGAKFPDRSPEIESQQVGRVVNPDIADQVNTLQKMAQKRALIAATLLAVNASEFFTQDMEDMVIDIEVVEAKPTPANRTAPPREFEPVEAEPVPVRPVRLEGAQPADKPANSKSDNTTVNNIMVLAGLIGWDGKTLANEVQRRFGTAISDMELAHGLEFLPTIQLKELLQVLQAERRNRERASA